MSTSHTPDAWGRTSCDTVLLRFVQGVGSCELLRDVVITTPTDPLLNIVSGDIVKLELDESYFIQFQVLVRQWRNVVITDPDDRSQQHTVLALVLLGMEYDPELATRDVRVQLNIVNDD